jgi:hypothetical protein
MNIVMNLQVSQNVATVCFCTEGDCSMQVVRWVNAKRAMIHTYHLLLVNVLACDGQQ